MCASSNPSAAPICSFLDDFGLEPLDAGARHDLLEILEERYGHRSTVVTSQLLLSAWHEVIGDPTYADAILDRLVHNAHRIELTGESLRRTEPNNPKRLDPEPRKGRRTSSSQQARRPGWDHLVTGGGIIQESLGAIIPLQTGGFVGIGSRIQLLIIDELGYVPLSQTGAELLFEIFS
jgi:hypothetical protein